MRTNASVLPAPMQLTSSIESIQTTPTGALSRQSIQAIAACVESNDDHRDALKGTYADLKNCAVMGRRIGGC